MSTTDSAGLFDFIKVKRTEMAGAAKTLVTAFFQNEDPPPQDDAPDNPTALESSPVEWWQHYGFISRPPKDAEAFILRFGSNCLAIASRVITAAKVFGQLAEGDVALFAVPGNMIKLGADGTIVFRVPTDGGEDMILALSGKKGGSLKFVIPGGPAIEWSKEKGITHNAGDKNLTSATTAKIQNIAAMMVDEVGAHKLHMAGAKPLVGVACLTPGAPNCFM